MRCARAAPRPGEILGPLFAGVLVAAAGAGWAIAADAGTFALSAACLLGLQLATSAAGRRGSFVADLRGGWSAFASRPWVWSFVVYFAIANVFWGAMSALGPVVADRELGGAAVWGAILAAMGAGAFIGSLAATQLRPSRPLLVVALGEGLLALPLAFLAATSVVALIACGAFLSGIGLMVGMSVWESTMQRHIPRDALSRVSSYDWFGSAAFYPIGLAVWGPISAVIGIHTSLWVAFALFVASLLALVAVPDVRRLPWAPATVVEPDSSIIRT